ncbi:MAG: hypothetical protein RSB59_04890 [Clostridia bacterium]
MDTVQTVDANIENDLPLITAFLNTDNHIFQNQFEDIENEMIRIKPDIENDLINTSFMKHLNYIIKNFDKVKSAYAPDEINLKDLQSINRVYSKIIETIDVRELELLWFLRHSRRGELQRFMDIAKLNYETFIKLLALRKPNNDIRVAFYDN